MDRVMEGLPALLVRLLVFGPIIYLGLHILLHPGWMAAVLRSAMEGIERSHHLVHGRSRWPDAHRSGQLPLAALRWCGLVLTVYGLLGLSGLAHP